MIPKFPEFKKLQISDKTEIEEITTRFPPYSDFNFTSIWCWDTKGEAELSILNSNLVIRFTDYVSRDPFYSFIGSNEIGRTIEELIKYTKKNNYLPILRLIPEHLVYMLGKSNFHVTEDEDNFDYILPIDSLVTYRGNKLGPKRNFVNRFKRNYQSTTSRLNFKNRDVQQEILRVFQLWIGAKDTDASEAENEYLAISRLLYLEDFRSIYIIGVFVDQKLVGFSINEVLRDEYAILHFEKADISFVGIYAYIMQQTAIALLKAGCHYLNYEQDLGIGGLKKCKMQYRPSAFLRKYKISWPIV